MIGGDRRRNPAILPDEDERRADVKHLLARRGGIQSELKQAGINFEKYDELMAALRDVNAKLAGYGEREEF
jgi:hypothetical protein